MKSLRAIFWAVGLIAVMIFFAVTAPDQSVPTDGKVHLQYWMITGMKEIMPRYAATFPAMHPNLAVETTLIPWQEHEKKILTAVLSGNPPDVVNQVTPVPKWASRMALMALDDFIARDEFDTTQFFPSLWQEMKWQGHVFALPVFSGSFAFFYNKRLFREAGLDPERPPKTWDEVREFNRKLVRRDERGQIVRMGFLPNYGNVMTPMLMAWELGARFMSDDGKTVYLDNAELVKGLEWTVDFYKEYPHTDVAAFMAGFGFADQHPFMSEKVAMMVIDNTFPAQVRIYKPGLDYGIAIIPTFQGYPTASSSGSWWMAIPRGAKNPEAAWQFMKYAVSKRVQLEEVLTMDESLFPANRAAAYDTAFNTTVERNIFVTEMEYSHSPSVVPMAHDIFWREFFGAQERVVYGLQTPRDALRQGNEVLQANLDDALAYDSYVRGKLKFPGVK
jgi:multiple sugar transport system substrate-binding protein